MKMMKCGHTANAVASSDNHDCCVICNCHEVQDDKPSLKGRKARCCYCGKDVNSSWDLAFFKHCSGKEFDEYYCGCYGWD